MEGIGPVEELTLLLLVLYLAECIRWVGRGSTVLRTVFFGGWHVARPWHPAAHWRRALAWSMPLPPLGALHVMDDFPVIVGPKGVTVGLGGPAGSVKPGAQARHVPWHDSKRLSVEEQEVRLDGQAVAAFGTRRMARAFSALLREIQEGKAARREPTIERFARRRFDRDEVLERRRRWRTWGAPLVIACNVFLIGLAIALYLLLYTSLSHHWWRQIVLGAVTLWCFTGLMFDLALWKAIDEDGKPALGRRAITLLSPMSLVRAADELRVELYGDLDPLAVAAVYLPKRAFAERARRVLAELQWPVDPPEGRGPDAAMKDDAWFRELAIERVEKLVVSRGMSMKSLWRDAVTPDGGSRAYCPRCLSQYVNAEGACQNCPGVPLRPFEAEAAA